MVIALGVAWILDGLEITVASAVVGKLTDPTTLALSTTEAGLIATVYLIGEVVGALFFGRMSDKLGRKKLFLVTLAVYLVGSGLTALTLNNGAGWITFLYVTRFIAGMGIGGEYAAINSAIDELIPAEHRGRVDLIINGSFWLGAIGGSLLSIVALDTGLLPMNVGWRLTFALGAVLALVILLVRRHVPESPRWLLIHGRDREAEEIVCGIERQVEREKGAPLPEPRGELEIRQRESVTFLEIARTVFGRYRRRAVLGFSLFIGQAFLYNAITFGFGAILTKFFNIPSDRTGYYFAVIAVGNFCGPLLLGRLFDTVGRRVMISSTYLLSGLLLFGTAWLFDRGSLSAGTLTACWCAVLFFASAGASSAYLTVSEIFPMETRAMSIAFFYALGTAAGGISGPLLFADLTGTGKVGDTVLAFSIGAALMCAAGLVAAALAVRAERRSLEDIARPLTAVATRARSATRGTRPSPGTPGRGPTAPPAPSGP
jgi:MFS family permease